MDHFVAYYRVSTDKQGRSGLGLEAQRASVRAYLGNRPLHAEYTEVESGKTNERPELQRALAEARSANATLVIARLDRLSRNVAFIASLLESKVRVVAADMPEANTLTLHIMAAVAHYEREAISERTRAALAAARARGTRLGNPRIADTVEVRQRNADAFAASVYPIIERIRGQGVVSLSGIAGALNARGVKTRRGSVWTARAVANLINRVDNQRTTQPVT